MFTFEIDPEDWFEERSRQFSAWGIPRGEIARVRSAVEHAWRESPGGWAFEWTRVAQDAERRERWLHAAACYGAARFPCAATPLRLRAAERQLDCFLRAVPDFRCHFERRSLHVPYGDGVTPVRVHLYEPRASGDPGERHWPIVLLSGGVDTFKIELHRLALALARWGGFTVAAMDMPGTGESEIALAPDADRIYTSVLETLRAARGAETPAGMLGISFGGHWATKLALEGGLDAVVNLGGPIGAGAASAFDLTRLPNGMAGIVANAMGLPELPDEQAARALFEGFSLRDRLDVSISTPLLVANGALDAYVPAQDVETFRGRPGVTVWRVQAAEHCAANRLGRVFPGIVTWLRMRLHGPSATNRLLHGVGRALLPPLVSPSVARDPQVP